MSILTFLYDGARNVSKSDSEEFEELVFVLSREQGTSVDHFEEKTPKAPHINRMVVRNTEHYLRCPIHSTLHVREASSVVFAASTKVNDFNMFCIFVCEEYIFRFNIAVDDSFIFHKEQSLTDLLGNCLNLKHSESVLLAPFHHHFLVEVQV